MKVSLIFLSTFSLSFLPVLLLSFQMVGWLVGEGFKLSLEDVSPPHLQLKISANPIKTVVKKPPTAFSSNLHKPTHFLTFRTHIYVETTAKK